MIVDTSVLLSIIFNESASHWSEKKLDEYKNNLKMSTVNLAEVLILVESRQPVLAESIRLELYKYPIEYIPSTKNQAEIVAKARIKYPLNLGDCFAYALAKSEGNPIITLDKDFLKTDLDVVSPY